MADAGNAITGPGESDGHPPVPTPESAAFFRAMLAEISETPGSMARLMKRLGDDRQDATIRRSIERMAAGDARVSGEMRVLLNMLKRGRAKRAQRRAAAAVDPRMEGERNPE